MSVHARQAIREAAKAQLLGKTGAGAQVVESRMIPWRTRDLPAIAIYTLSESVDHESTKSAPRELKRELELAIEAAVVAAADVDDQLDALALDIERAMHADYTIGGTAGDAVLRSTEVTLDQDGEQLIGIVRLVFGVTYFTNAPDAADQTLDNLNTVDTHYDLGGAQETANQAEDKVTNLNP